MRKNTKLVEIFNITKNTVLADRAIYADTFLTRLVGLLNKKRLNKNEALVLYPCNMVHTIGMRFTIDVVFVSQNDEVIHIKDNMKPYKFSPQIKKAIKVIELPAGFIEETKTQIGDRILIKQKPAK